LLLVRGFRSLAFLFECLFQSVEAFFPEVAVLGQPPVERAKRLGLERVKPPLSLRPHRNEACIVEDVQVAGHTGLVNPCPGNEVIDLMLTMPQGFHDATARRVGKGLESV
jgi:hypothetical protein